MTETSAACTTTCRDENTLLHCGVPIGCNEVKLRDVPEMKYFHTDPLPRGEILVRGSNIFAGYFKNDEATKETLEDGWLCTGDIGRFNANGTLSIIDRKKNIFKLSQGEYIAAERVETIYGKSPVVAQVWVYGNSFKSFLLAVIVPNSEVIRTLCEEKHWWPTPKDKVVIADDTYLKDFETVWNGDHKDFLKRFVFDQISKENVHLKGFEKVKDILIESKLDKMLAGFTEKNECLTPTFKLKRPFLLKRYVKQLRDLYAENGESSKDDEKW